MSTVAHLRDALNRAEVRISNLEAMKANREARLAAAVEVERELEARVRELEAQLAAVTTPVEPCELPPPGWWRCTRVRGHEGPCACVPIEGDL